MSSNAMGLEVLVQFGLHQSCVRQRWTGGRGDRRTCRELTSGGWRSIQVRTTANEMEGKEGSWSLARSEGEAREGSSGGKLKLKSKLESIVA